MAVMPDISIERNLSARVVRESGGGEGSSLLSSSPLSIPTFCLKRWQFFFLSQLPSKRSTFSYREFCAFYSRQLQAFNCWRY